MRKKILTSAIGLAVIILAVAVPVSSSGSIEVAGISYGAGDIEELEEFKRQSLEVEEINQDMDVAVEQNVEVASPSDFLTSYEMAILDSINQIRQANGLGALTANAHLTDIARQRSSDMLSRNYFSHYTPEGTNIFNILQANGVTYRNAGENLAHSRPADVGSVGAFMDAWMQSPGHRQNILRDVYGMIGIGEVNNGSRRVVTTVFKNG